MEFDASQKRAADEITHRAKLWVEIHDETTFGGKARLCGFAPATGVEGRAMIGKGVVPRLKFIPLSGEKKSRAHTKSIHAALGNLTYLML